MKYYVILNGKQAGPFEEAQLQTMGLTRDTMVWREGMQQWQRADSLQELSYLFNNGYNQGGYNPGGYNPAGGGYNPGGYNQGGYNPGGYNPAGGYNPGGYNPGGYNPGGYNGMPPMPETYLVWAILATVLCCVPFGIVSIVNAAGVSSAYNQGNYQLAQQKSDNAKKWAIISAVCGFVFSIIYAIIIIAEGGY